MGFAEPSTGKQTIVDDFSLEVWKCYLKQGLFIDALWSPAGKGLTTWLSFVMLNSVFVTFLCGILGQVWYLIVSIPDLCPFIT